MARHLSRSLSRLVSQRYWTVLALIYCLCVGVRLIAVAQGNFPFWFDSGRDAVISREILEHHDLKIQGPNASGTHDSVFHGVAYYYLIGPLYTLTGGSPQLVLGLLILLTGLTVIPVSQLGQALTGSKTTGLVAAVLYSTSFEALRGGTWLSNPIMASVSIPFFFWLLWLVFFEQRVKYFPWLMAALALCQQAVIFFALLWGVVFVSAYWQWSHRRAAAKQWNRRLIFIGLAVYGLGTATMILAQLKAWHDGLFSLSHLSEINVTSIHGIEGVGWTLVLYTQKIVNQFLPSAPVAGASWAVVVGYAWFRRQRSAVTTFSLLALSSPLWVLGWHFRYLYHGFIGLEFFGSIFLAWWFTQVVARWRWGTGLAIGLMLAYLFSNTLAWRAESQQRSTVYFIPQGASFADELAAIDYTYQAAAGQPFSISTFTNPYGYNTLWAYLYQWYGQKKYGYTPHWYGPDQSGLFGGELLTRSAAPDRLHFTLWEPGPGLPEHLMASFAQEQQAAVGTASATQFFGTLKVESRLHQP